MTEHLAQANPPLNVFLSYAPEDADLRRRLDDSLDRLRREGLIEQWNDRQIEPGEEWLKSADKHLKTADLVLFLVSPEFLATDYCNGMEVHEALDSHHRGNSRILPILLKSADWSATPIKKLDAFPRDGKPIAERDDIDAALKDVSDGIRQAVQDLWENVQRQDGSGAPSGATSDEPSLATSDEPSLATSDEPSKVANEVHTIEATVESSMQPSSLSSLEQSVKKIGRYAVKKTLGEGAFGTVYLAHDDQLDRLVAIKVPKKSRISKPKDVDNYKKEARIVANLEHPNIVPVYDVGETSDGLCFVVSRYIEGSDLQSKKDEFREPKTKAVELIATIAEALNYAHEHEITHRDIKPANILIDSAGQPYVADFGLAMKDEDYGKSGAQAGTPAYMSPEQARAEGHRVDGRSDVFSLGVVFYELLTGRRPFRSKKISDLLQEVAHSDVQPPRQRDKTISRELERICLRALANRMSDRYTTARDFADDLREYLASPPTDSGTGFTSTTASGSRSRSRRSTGSAAIHRSDGVSSSGTGRSSTAQARGTSSTIRMTDTSGEVGTSSINPKGLSSFDRSDSEIFLDLLAGPRDRYGLPETIRFWKLRIEEPSPDRTFPVGLIYGPSGCGKTSFLEAGLFPNLGEHVRVVAVDATSARTESRLRTRLSNEFREFRDRSDLSEILAAIRKGEVLEPGEKVLLFIDQFEQWLHTHDVERDLELVDALRQCDGGRLQCLLSVRADYLMGIHRFMRKLDVPIQEGTNSAIVDSFDPIHARHVLEEFGKSLGTVEGNGDGLSDKSDAFLSEAITELDTNGKIVPAQLALFVEMFRTRSWDVPTLKKMGGAKGTGVKFLEDTFHGDQVRLELRTHGEAAQSILGTLLPEPGVEIRKQRTTTDELQQACGYSNRQDDFDQLMRTLDHDLRLITPADDPGEEGEASDEQQQQQQGGPKRRFYQLSHDFLVPSLREWIDSKQKATPQGRAELRLKELASLWDAKQENRHLPSLLEYIDVRRNVPKTSWSPRAENMMRRATKFYGTKIVIGMLVGVVALSAISLGRSYLRGNALVDTLVAADFSELNDAIGQVKNHRFWTAGKIESQYNAQRANLASLDEQLAISEAKRNETNPESEDWKTVVQQHEAAKEQRDQHLLGNLLRPSLAMLALGLTGADVQQAVVESIPVASREMDALQVIRDELASTLGSLDPQTQNGQTEQLWQQVSQGAPGGQKSDLLSIACVLAKLHANDPRWQENAGKVAAWLVSDPSMFVDKRIEFLQPVASLLAPELSMIFRDTSRSEVDRVHATSALATYLADEPAKLLELMVDSKETTPFLALYEVLKSNHKQELAKGCEGVLAKELDFGAEDSAKEALALQKVNAAVALMRLNQTEHVWPLFKDSKDCRIRSYLTHKVSPMGVDSRLLIERLAGNIDADERHTLLLAVGEYDKANVDNYDQFLLKVLEWYEFDPDSGVHGSAEWLLRHWGEMEKIESRLARLLEDEQDLQKRSDRDKRDWYVSTENHTMCIVRGKPSFSMGSPKTEVGRVTLPKDSVAIGGEDERAVQIPRVFAVSNKEVSVGQFKRYRPDFVLPDTQAQDLNCPMANITWFAAVAYCNWLSKQEGIPKEQWCYPEDGPFANGLQLPNDYLKRTGYRLPTEAEWEFICRAGTETSRFFGQSEHLLRVYGWFAESGVRPSLVGMFKPNGYGMFDMYGNVSEWTHTRAAHPLPVAKSFFTQTEIDSEEIYGLTVAHASSDRFIHRGGGFDFLPKFIRSADRSNRLFPDDKNLIVGFRVARTMPSGTESAQANSAQN